METVSRDIAGGERIVAALEALGAEIEVTAEPSGAVRYNATLDGFRLDWTDRAPIVVHADGGHCTGSSFVVTPERAAALAAVVRATGGGTGVPDMAPVRDPSTWPRDTEVSGGIPDPPTAKKAKG